MNQTQEAVITFVISTGYIKCDWFEMVDEKPILSVVFSLCQCRRLANACLCVRTSGK